MSQTNTADDTSPTAIDEVTNAQCRALTNAMPNLCWMARPDGWIFWYNRKWYDYTGTTPAEMSGWGWQSVHDPNVLPSVLQRWTNAIATGQPFEMTFPLRGADGVFRPFLTRIEPLREAGEIVGWFGANVDITDLENTKRRLEILVDELNHRVKNTLATVQSMAIQSFADSSTADGLKKFQGRLIALSEAQNVLTKETWHPVAVRDIVTGVLGFCVASRMDILGDGDVKLASTHASNLAMILHELATNAVTFGALSNSAGRVAVTWRVENTILGRTLSVVWLESDGPPVTTPLRKGFGTQLITTVLNWDPGATVNLEFASEGVRCDITILAADGT